jgi:hypothetical protein
MGKACTEILQGTGAPGEKTGNLYIEGDEGRKKGNKGCFESQTGGKG